MRSKKPLGHMANTNSDLPNELPHTKNGKKPDEKQPKVKFDRSTLPRTSVNRR